MNAGRLFLQIASYYFHPLPTEAILISDIIANPVAVELYWDAAKDDSQRMCKVAGEARLVLSFIKTILRKASIILNLIKIERTYNIFYKAYYYFYIIV